MDIHVYVHIHAGWKDISSEVVGSNESVVLTRVEMNKEQPSITMSETISRGYCKFKVVPLTRSPFLRFLQCGPLCCVLL